MSTVIKVENLSKRYRIGLRENRKDTLFGQLGSMIKAPMENFQRLRSLSSFDYDDESVFWALRDINFEVQQGEVLGIIGHNGAGKSTLLKILSRITEPTDGRITVTGRIGALLEVGTGFHPELTGRDNIYMNGTILGMTRLEIDRKFDEIVDFSGVEKYIDTPVKFYSSGMKVRLGFAVAAHLEPEILIIDEVLAVGDTEFQKRCLGKMEDVSVSGRTVLFVSHDLGAVESLCPRSMLLQNGHNNGVGETNEIINKYINKNVHQTKGYLKERKDRKGSLKAFVEDIYISDGNKKERLDTIISGQKTNFHININATNFEKINSVHIGLAITDEMGRFVTVLNNKMRKDDFRIVNSKKLELVCILNKLPFMYGRYWVRSALVINGEFCDMVDKASSFFVIEGDYYNSGYINSQKRQGIYIEQEWSINENERT